MIQILSQDQPSLELYDSAQMDAQSWEMPLDFIPGIEYAEAKSLNFDDLFVDILAPDSASSTSSTTTDDDELALVDEPRMVSSAFLPQNRIVGSEPDVILRSVDNIHFYVHSSLLYSQAVAFSTSSETEQGLPIFGVEDHSNVLNIILHTIYGMSCAQFNHEFAEIIKAVDRLPSYGVQPKGIITPSHPLYDLILSLSPLHPLPIYALAARHELESLAVKCSSRLLSFPLDRLSDENASSIGPVYLKRLFLLHHHRRQKLGEQLLQQFYPHPVTPPCDFFNQQSVSRAWTLTAASFLLDLRPDTSNQQLQSTFGTLIPLIECRDCRDLVESKLKDMIVNWSMVKVSI